MISLAATGKLISAFVFAFAKCLFSHDEVNFLQHANTPMQTRPSFQAPLFTVKLGLHILRTVFHMDVLT